MDVMKWVGLERGRKLDGSKDSNVITGMGTLEERQGGDEARA